MQRLIVFTILATGLSGIGAQVLLLRELLVSFLGNELTLGVIIGNWLLAEALGAWWGGRRERELGAFVSLQILFAMALPVGIIVARTFKIWGGEAAVAGGIGEALLQSAWILAPSAFLHGALFPLGCSLLRDRGGETKAIVRAYLWETLGTVFGGLTVAFSMLPLFSPLELVFGISSLHLFLCGVLSKGRKRIALLSAFALCALWIPLGVKDLERGSLERRWRGYKVLHQENSLYGNLLVLSRGGEYTFMLNGAPVASVPHPDPYVEVFVHLPMLHHPDPKRVLVISGGIGGVLREILRHPIQRVDYVELDPALIKLFKTYSPPSTTVELDDPRVHLHLTDGRRLLQRSPLEYDLIFLGLGLPSDLQVNRLFTREAFELAASKLGTGGILVLQLPGSAVYLGPQLRKLLGLLIATLRGVFPHIKVSPGESTLVMASRSPLDVSEDSLFFRMGERGIDPKLLSPAMISYLLSEERRRWFWENVPSVHEENTDLHPLAVYYSLTFQGALFDPAIEPILEGLREVKARWGAILALAVFTALLSIRRRRGAVMVVGVTGFYGMTVELLLLYAFQTFYGYIYQWIGLLVSAFMVGAALGALTAEALAKGGKASLRGVLFLEGAMGVYVLLMPVLLGSLKGSSPWAFLPLAVVAGGLLGGQFPLAAALYGRGAARSGGVLYAADLLGGWIAGILAGVALLPLRGIVQTCWFLAALKGAGLGGMALGGGG